MLLFYYTFLTLVLSSSVIAVGPNEDIRFYRPQDGKFVLPDKDKMPSPNDLVYHRQDDGTSVPLINNIDGRLPKGYWVRVSLTTSAAKNEASVNSDWTDDAQYLDDVLRLVRGTGKRQGLEKVELRRIERQLVTKRERTGPAGEITKNHYSIRSQRDCPTKTSLLGEPLPIEDCSLFLNNTYWGRLPEILGQRQGRRPVSDGLMIWKS